MSCARLALLLISLTASTARAQFNVILPQPRSATELRREDFRRQFVTRLDRNVRAQVSQRTLSPNEFTSRRDAYCDQFSDETERNECRDALTPNAISAFAAGTAPRITQTLLHPSFPLFHSRSALAEYLRSTGASEGLAVFAQFNANVSDDEAYVVTNVVRGLTGPAIFAVDYAAVVTKAESQQVSETDRKEIENDKATLLRMINNGGTLVGRFQAPIHAISGGTFSSASALTAGAGLIGPIGDASARHAAGTVTGEFMSSIAIRDLDGHAEKIAELVLGARAGYSRSDASLLTNGTRKGIAYGQVAIGLRRKGDMSLSALITQTEKPFRANVPRMVVNFSAIR